MDKSVAVVVVSELKAEVVEEEQEVVELAPPDYNFHPMMTLTTTTRILVLMSFYAGTCIDSSTQSTQPEMVSPYRYSLYHY